MLLIDQLYHIIYNLYMAEESYKPTIGIDVHQNGLVFGLSGKNLTPYRNSALKHINNIVKINEETKQESIHS